MKSLLGLWLCWMCSIPAWSQLYTQPEQVHLSLGELPGQFVVTWVTQAATNTSTVEYGIGQLDQVAYGTVDVFTDGGSQQRVLYMHRTVIPDLKPTMKYLYHCGSSDGWSPIYTFTALRTDSDWSPRFALFGDMGNKNARSLGRLQEETEKGHFDMIVHVGDFAYNMDTDNAMVGDAFMNQIQSIAAYVPYMTCVGNHEQAYNFSNYMSRFTMPKKGGDGHNMFFSFDIGPVHFVSFSSEYYYYTNYGWKQIVNQYRWLEQDLKTANEPENRRKRPWIISMCHRPLYCSNSDDKEHCTNNENVIRVGFPDTDRLYSIEDLLYKYGVDLHFQAHEHSYERMWPTYNMTVCNGTGTDPYNNPPAPVHIVTGSGGCQEGEDPFLAVPNPWSAYHSDDYGYTRMNVINDTHLYLEQVSDDKGGVVIDKMLIRKDVHGPHTFDCHKRQRPQDLPWMKPYKSNAHDSL